MMAKQCLNVVQFIGKLHLGAGAGSDHTAGSKKYGVTEQTYYRWQIEYCGLRTDQAKRFKELERENALLKGLLADAELDKAIFA
jgi:hypothetical protein